MRLWPHQEYGIDATVSAIAEGSRRIVLTSPTGGGKTVMVARIIRHILEHGMRAGLYTNRRLLIDQVSDDMKEFGLEHGIRAAGHEDRRELPFQISSIQTEGARAIRREEHLRWQLHDADLVAVDEAHLQTGPTAAELFRRHEAAGAAMLYVSATPVGLGQFADKLIVAGTNSELRRCGALVPAMHYGPDEPDLKHIRGIVTGKDLTENQNKKAIMVPGIFGRVVTWWNILNRHQLPTILFAPGVAESLWFAQEFWKLGIPAGHIDGDVVWINGEFWRADPSARARLLAASEAGDIKVMCNRFVLREGIDAPWLRHGIFACVFGSLSSYLQSGGRLLRRCPGKTEVTIQDHGGNWWRHGSLNADRVWNLDWSAQMYTGARWDRLRAKKEKEPCRCVSCGLILTGLVCPCGHVVPPGRRSRPVIMEDGSLKEHTGDIFRPIHRQYRSDTRDLWTRMYYRAKKSGMTFRQAEGLFARENFYHPPDDLPLMPVEAIDWWRVVADVPRANLRR